VNIPDWVFDAVFYQIFPDRFASSSRVEKPQALEAWDSPSTVHGFKGGDLLGVAERLDYLEDLGVNAIYLNPVFQSAANHRYHTHDYFQVDPLLGGNGALRDLIDNAHKKGMHIILDGVFNHASRGFFQFNHILENGAHSPFIDWFHVDKQRLAEGEGLDAYPSRGTLSQARKEQNSFELLGYRGWWDLPELPKFRVETPEVREFLLGVARHWISFGADGWRLDVPEEIPDRSFWQEFRSEVRKINPDAYLLGEIWTNAASWLEGDRFDAVMNYVFNRACVGFFGGESIDPGYAPGGFTLSVLSAVDFRNVLHELMEQYAWPLPLAQYNLLSSHDEARFLTASGGDMKALILATLFQVTFPGVPGIYYGDEVGMVGGEDPLCRGPFPWDPAAWSVEILHACKAALRLRREHVALRRGTFQWLDVFGGERVIAFRRSHREEEIVCVMNAGPQTAVVNLNVGHLFGEGVTTVVNVWQDAATGTGTASYRVRDGVVPSLQVDGKRAVVLALQQSENVR